MERDSKPEIGPCPDDLLALRDNIQACRPTSDGPPSRVVPESMCSEIESVLRYLEAEARRQEQLPKFE